MSTGPKGQDDRARHNRTAVVGKKNKPRQPRKGLDAGNPLEIDLLALNREALEAIDADPSVHQRPSIRWYRRMMWMPMTHMNGAPFVDPKSGEVIKLSKQELLVTAIITAAISQQHPRQFEMAQLAAKYLFGSTPEHVQLTGANGGPVQVQDVPVDPAELTARIASTIGVLRDLAGGGDRKAYIPVEVTEVAQEQKATITATYTPLPAPQSAARPVVGTPLKETPIPTTGMIRTR